MDRQVLVALLRNGMRYPVGTHQIWALRCFEITVRPNRTVQVDEYECYREGHSPMIGDGQPIPRDHAGMYHVGRSVISPKGDHAVEDVAGAGWIPDSQDHQARRRGTMRV